MKIKQLIYLLLICFAVSNSLLFAQKVQNKRFDKVLKRLLKHNVTELSVKEAKKDSSLIYLDAREFCEYQSSHIKGAIWIGTDSIQAAKLITLDSSKNYIVYCSIGYRSENMTRQLNAKGFKNAANLYGGIFEWINQGNPVVDANDQPTQKEHAFSKPWGIWVNKGQKVYKCPKS
jgi:rhodanese-related sulfurtransferase